MKIEVVYFDDEYFALIAEQNDWSGNWIYTMRKVRGAYGEEFVNYNSGKVSVAHACQKARELARENKDMRKRLKELERLL